MSKLMKSSALEGGTLGLQGAMILANEAHAAFDDAIRLQSFDPTLAEAGLVCSIPHRGLFGDADVRSFERYLLFLNPLPTPNTRLAVRRTPSSTSTTSSKTFILLPLILATKTCASSPPIMFPWSSLKVA